MNKGKRNHGVITVLISFLLVGILSIGTVVMEAGRLQAAKTQLAEANISAATSMIAAYDADLYTRYGLLAIDTERFTLERATDYLNFNADLGAGYMGNNATVMHSIENVELLGMYNLTYPAIMKRQILSRAKYHVVPQDYAINVYTIDSFFTDFQLKCSYVADKLTSVASGSAATGAITDVGADMLSALSSLYATYKDLKTFDEKCAVTLNSSSVALLPSVTGTVENEAPQEDIDEINAVLADATTILGSTGSILQSGASVANTEIDVSADVSFVPDIKNKLTDISTAPALVADTKVLAAKTKAVAQAFNNAINVLKADKEGNLLLNSYISDYFSNRNVRVKGYSAPAVGTAINGTMNNAAFASACVEYVFGGKASETANQSEAYNYVQAIRLVNNLFAVMTDSTSFKPTNVYSVAAHLAWANYESIADMELTTTFKGSVPLNKNKMILPVNSAGSVSSAYGSKNSMNALKTLGCISGADVTVSGSGAMSYKDSLSFALWFIPNSKKMLRIADLIQLEMRYNEQHVEQESATFLMSEQNTYCRISCTGEFNPLLPMISLDGSNTSIGTDIKSIKYAGY